MESGSDLSRSGGSYKGAAVFMQSECCRESIYGHFGPFESNTDEVKVRSTDVSAPKVNSSRSFSVAEVRKSLDCDIARCEPATKIESIPSSECVESVIALSDDRISEDDGKREAMPIEFDSASDSVTSDGDWGLGSDIHDDGIQKALGLTRPECVPPLPLPGSSESILRIGVEADGAVTQQNNSIEDTERLSGTLFLGNVWNPNESEENNLFTEAAAYSSSVTSIISSFWNKFVGWSEGDSTVPRLVSASRHRRHLSVSKVSDSSFSAVIRNSTSSSITAEAVEKATLIGSRHSESISRHTVCLRNPLMLVSASGERSTGTSRVDSAHDVECGHRGIPRLRRVRGDLGRFLGNVAPRPRQPGFFVLCTNLRVRLRQIRRYLVGLPRFVSCERLGKPHTFWASFETSEAAGRILPENIDYSIDDGMPDCRLIFSHVLPPPITFSVWNKDLSPRPDSYVGGTLALRSEKKPTAEKNCTEFAANDAYVSRSCKGGYGDETLTAGTNEGVRLSSGWLSSTSFRMMCRIRRLRERRKIIDRLKVKRLNFQSQTPLNRDGDGLKGMTTLDRCRRALVCALSDCKATSDECDSPRERCLNLAAENVCVNGHKRLLYPLGVDSSIWANFLIVRRLAEFASVLSDIELLSLAYSPLPCSISNLNLPAVHSCTLDPFLNSRLSRPWDIYVEGVSGCDTELSDTAVVSLRSKVLGTEGILRDVVSVDLSREVDPLMTPTYAALRKGGIEVLDQYNDGCQHVDMEGFMMDSMSSSRYSAESVDPCSSTIEHLISNGAEMSSTTISETRSTTTAAHLDGSLDAVDSAVVAGCLFQTRALLERVLSNAFERLSCGEAVFQVNLIRDPPEVALCGTVDGERSVLEIGASLCEYLTRLHQHCTIMEIIWSNHGHEATWNTPELAMLVGYVERAYSVIIGRTCRSLHICVLGWEEKSVDMAVVHLEEGLQMLGRPPRMLGSRSDSEAGRMLITMIPSHFFPPLLRRSRIILKAMLFDDSLNFWASCCSILKILGGTDLEWDDSIPSESYYSPIYFRCRKTDAYFVLECLYVFFDFVASQVDYVCAAVPRELVRMISAKSREQNVCRTRFSIFCSAEAKDVPSADRNSASFSSHGDLIRPGKCKGFSGEDDLPLEGSAVLNPVRYINDVAGANRLVFDTRRSLPAELAVLDRDFFHRSRFHVRAVQQKHPQTDRHVRDCMYDDVLETTPSSRQNADSAVMTAAVFNRNEVPQDLFLILNKKVALSDGVVAVVHEMSRRSIDNEVYVVSGVPFGCNCAPRYEMRELFNEKIRVKNTGIKLVKVESHPQETFNGSDDRSTTCRVMCDPLRSPSKLSCMVIRLGVACDGKRGVCKHQQCEHESNVRRRFELILRTMFPEGANKREVPVNEVLIPYELGGRFIGPEGKNGRYIRLRTKAYMLVVNEKHRGPDGRTWRRIVVGGEFEARVSLIVEIYRLLQWPASTSKVPSASINPNQAREIAEDSRANLLDILNLQAIQRSRLLGRDEICVQLEKSLGYSTLAATDLPAVPIDSAVSALIYGSMSLVIHLKFRCEMFVAASLCESDARELIYHVCFRFRLFHNTVAKVSYSVRHGFTNRNLNILDVSLVSIGLLRDLLDAVDGVLSVLRAYPNISGLRVHDAVQWFVFTPLQQCKRCMDTKRSGIHEMDVASRRCSTEVFRTDIPWMCVSPHICDKLNRAWNTHVDTDRTHDPAIRCRCDVLDAEHYPKLFRELVRAGEEKLIEHGSPSKAANRTIRTSSDIMFRRRRSADAQPITIDLIRRANAVNQEPKGDAGDGSYTDSDVSKLSTTACGRPYKECHELLRVEISPSIFRSSNGQWKFPVIGYDVLTVKFEGQLDGLCAQGFL